jgi:ATP adenylyltransferase
MEYIRGKSNADEGCLFEPPGTEDHSRQHLMLYRDHMTVVLLNRYPYTNGHLLVAPVRHVAGLTELKADEAAAVMHMLQKCTEILKRHLHFDGINIGCNIGEPAGAGLADHLHFHLVPRWQGDHNYMTVIADIRTIPEHLDLTFDRLLPDFRTLSLEL